MKYTLLELTQRILSSLGGDEVNSITDTVESTDVANIIKETYNRITTEGSLRETKRLYNLDATSSATPTILTKPATVETIEWFRYNKRTATDTVDVWGDVKWMEPDEFLVYIQNYDHAASNVSSFTHTLASFNTKIYYVNDKAPDYWTTFDDNYIICDSYDVGVDSNLQQSKTSCFGKVGFTFTMADNFTPPLDSDQFDLLLQESKAVAFIELKQTENAKAEKTARRGWVRSQTERTEHEIDYGRRSRAP